MVVVNSLCANADELATLLYHLHQLSRVLAGVSPPIATIGAVLWSMLRSGKAYAVLDAAAKHSCRKTVNLARCGSRLCRGVHGDNIVLTSAGLRLIGWEYADGDIALELAAVSG